MRVIEDLSKSGSSSHINDLKYRQIPKDFSGLIFFYNFKKQFLNGYKYTDGKILNKIGAPVANKSGSSSQSIKKIRTETYGVCGYSTVVQEYCEWGGTADNPYQYFHGCTDTELYSFRSIVMTGQEMVVMAEGEVMAPAIMRLHQ